MDTIIKIGIGFIVAMVVMVTAEAIHSRPQEVQYDHNRDGTIDLIDVSIAIDTLNKTVEQCQ